MFFKIIPNLGVLIFILFTTCVQASVPACPSQEIINSIEYKEGINQLISEYGVFRYLPDRYHKDKNLAILAIRRSGKNFQYLSKDLRDDKALALTAIESDYNAFQFASARLRDNDDVAKRALSQYGALLKFASDRQKNDKNLLLYLLDKNKVNAYRFASDSLQNDSDIYFHENVLSGLPPSEYGFNDKQRDSFQFALSIIGKIDNIYNYLSPRLRENEELTRIAVSKNGRSLEYAGKKLRNNKEIVSLAIQNNPFSLQFASERLTKDKELVLLAVEKDPDFYLYINKLLQTDTDIQKVVNTKRNRPKRIDSEKQLLKLLLSDSYDKSSYHLLSPKLKQSRDLLIKAIKINSASYRYAIDKYKNDEEIAEIASKSNLYIYPYLPNKFKNNEKFLFTAMVKSEYPWGSYSELPEKYKRDKRVLKMWLKDYRHSVSMSELPPEFRYDKDLATVVIQTSYKRYSDVSSELYDDIDFIKTLARVRADSWTYEKDSGLKFPPLFDHMRKDKNWTAKKQMAIELIKEDSQRFELLPFSEQYGHADEDLILTAVESGWSDALKYNPNCLVERLPLMDLKKY